MIDIVFIDRLFMLRQVEKYLCYHIYHIRGDFFKKNYIEMKNKTLLLPHDLLSLVVKKRQNIPEIEKKRWEEFLEETTKGGKRTAAF